MPRLTRYGFDRRGARRVRPDELIRRPAPVYTADRLQPEQIAAIEAAIRAAPPPQRIAAPIRIQKLDLRGAPSAMEQRASSWRGRP